MYSLSGLNKVRSAFMFSFIDVFVKPNIDLGFVVTAFIKSSKSTTVFVAENKLSKPMTPSLASLNSTFLCSTSIGL